MIFALMLINDFYFDFPAKDGFALDTMLIGIIEIAIENQCRVIIYRNQFRVIAGSCPLMEIRLAFHFYITERRTVVRSHYFKRSGPVSAAVINCRLHKCARSSVT